MTSHAPGPPRTVLVTGLSGVVGTALAPELRRHRLLALTRRDSAPAGAELVRGDLTAPDLGLAAAEYAALARRVDVVVHAAAVTDFRSGPDEIAHTNVAGTRQVVRFAEHAGATLHHLSTAFVARSRLARRQVGDAAADPTGYLASKIAAEEVVRGAGVPVTLVRPSLVIGHSVTGAISRFQGLHSLVAAVLRGALPLVPLDPASLIDTVGTDVLARALAGLVDAEHTGVAEYWVTAGAEALTTGRTVELLVGLGQRLGLAAVRPRLVRPDMVDRLVRPVFIDPLPYATPRSTSCGPRAT